VGSAPFVTATKEKLGDKGIGRKVIEGDGSYELREPPVPYNGISAHENERLQLENTYFWDNKS
jgi:hypothetical protein